MLLHRDKYRTQLTDQSDSMTLSELAEHCYYRGRSAAQLMTLSTRALFKRPNADEGRLMECLFAHVLGTLPDREPAWNPDAS